MNVAPRLRRSAPGAAVLLGTTAAILVSIAIASRWLIVGSVKGGWFYGYAQPFGVAILAVALGVAVAAAALLWLVPAAGSLRRDWTWLAAAIVVALVAQSALRSVAPFPLERLFTSDSSNSFYSLTERHEPAELLRHFNRIRAEAPPHAQSNMPGKTMVIYALQQISPRPDVLPWLLIVLSNLGAVLVYLFARDALGDRRTALIAAGLYLFVPARQYFLPIMNTVTPVFALACAVLFLRWLRTGRTTFAILLGAALYGLVFFEPLPLVIGLLFAALAAAAIARGEVGWQRFALQSCAAIVTFIATAEVMRVAFGFDVIDALRRIAAHASDFNVQAGRPYGLWVYANLPEFAFGVGACQSILFVAAAIDAFGRDHAGWGERLTRPIAVPVAGLLATLLATDLIGINRGEVIRLWIFLACFFQIPAAFVCARVSGRWAAAAAGFSGALQGAAGGAMIEFVLP